MWKVHCFLAFQRLPPFFFFLKRLQQLISDNNALYMLPLGWWKKRLSHVTKLHIWSTAGMSHYNQRKTIPWLTKALKEASLARLTTVVDKRTRCKQLLYFSDTEWSKRIVLAQPDSPFGIYLYLPDFQDF